MSINIIVPIIGKGKTMTRLTFILEFVAFMAFVLFMLFAATIL